MKSTIKLFTLAFVALFAVSCNNNDEYDMLNSLWRNVTQNEARIDDLEKWCAQANTNITSLQTIVNVLESNGMVTSITPVMEGGVEIGYTITFSNHDLITIYHGKDGKDGQNGANGQNGTSPIVGVAKYTDGVYYWTLNGEWLLDENGNKLPVSGKDGQNGANGKDGQDGADGKDGITPLLKIENGYWYISYDNGATWAQLGKATGEDGKDGANGTNGADGSNGQDGITPQLKIENGYWYVSYDNGTTWTQFGKATGADGQDGQNGTDGKDGQDGTDGVTPQLKIENDYWWISYDNGNTWTQLGKAKGEDGQDGATGAQGEKGDKGDAGDSMFRSVTQDADNVYFTLADGTLITIAKGGGGADADVYTITYMPNGGKGKMKVDTVRYGCSYTIKSCSFTYPAYGFVEWNTAADGKGIAYITAESIVLMKNIILYAQWRDCVENGYVWIDLGLSVKWATCNVGANKPEEYGKYYAWGVTTPGASDWSTYKWCNGSKSTLTKYNTDSNYGTVDNKTVLELADDAARANWGGAWRMPTNAEWTELRTNCTWTWTTNYNGTGVAGRIVTGTNGNSIFLPAAGYRYGGSLSKAGSDGRYWSSSLSSGYPSEAWFGYFSSDNVGRDFNFRYYGQSVRPVLGE